MSRRSKRMSKKTKWLIAGIGGVSLVLIGGLIWLGRSSTDSVSAEVSYSITDVTEGNIASSTLLTGTAKALQEQYVYYDSTKGTDATVTVAVGDQITEGQQLVQYDTTTAQAAYDTAVRSLNKVGRQINYLKTYGNLPTTSTSTDEETGETTTTTVQPSAEQNAQYNQQLQDLNDAYADAQAEVTKAQQALNETVILSDVSGTVVEVNNDIDPSSKNSQTLVHVVSEGQLQIQGKLTEYDLPNVQVGQSVKITSKVYPGQEWTGTISYISNYPSQDTDATATSSSTTSGSGASYEYKVDITSDLGDLKQGFSVSAEVANANKQKLIPTSAVLTDNDKSYVWVYDKESQKVTKTEVTIGQSDATTQEILSGLETGQTVITNPDKSLKTGDKIDTVSEEDTTTDESEGVE